MAMIDESSRTTLQVGAIGSNLPYAESEIWSF